jgi:hypothetical protein
MMANLMVADAQTHDDGPGSRGAFALISLCWTMIARSRLALA